jgi:hypothetical protein
MTKCTDPEQWAAVPGSDASQEELESYFAHVRECVFHASIEQREEEQLRAVVALAKGTLNGRSSTLREREAATIREGFDALAAIRRHAFIRTLSIRVNGAERARLNLIEAGRVTLEIEEGAFVGIWQPAQAERAEDLYLTTYVLPTHRAASSDMKVSSMVLEGGQKISFAVEPRGSSKAQLTVTYAETHLLPALRLHIARLKYSVAARERETSRPSALKPVAGLLALLASLVLLSLLWVRTERPTQIANQADAPQPGGTLESSQPMVSPSSVPNTLNLNGNASTAPPAEVTPLTQSNPKQSGRDGAHINREPASVPSSQMSLAAVRRVYVGTGERENDGQLRAALIAQLRASGRFTVVAREQEADAVLVSEPTRSMSVRAQLLNRAGKPLWFTTQPIAGESRLDADDVAARIVRALSDETAKRTPRGFTPRP